MCVLAKYNTNPIIADYTAKHMIFLYSFGLPKSPANLIAFEMGLEYAK